MNKRIEWIDIAKGIGMLLVIFGHFGMNPAGKEAISFIKSSFHMPLFFVLSGLLFKDGSSAKDCFTWSMKRFIALMIPFYLWTAIYSNGSYKGFAGIIYASNKTLGGAGTNAAMWFIPCMCIAGILVKFGAQMITYAELYYIARENAQKLVLIDELKKFRRGYQFLDVFDPKSFTCINRKHHRFLDCYSQQYNPKNEWYINMKRIYKSRLFNKLDALVVNAVMENCLRDMIISMFIVILVII